MREVDLAPLRVVFDAETIRLYGGAGAGFHSDLAAARASGFPDLLSWGTLTMQPFWTLLERFSGTHGLVGAAISLRLSQAVCAGDEVEYSGCVVEQPDGHLRIKLKAESGRGVVASAEGSLRMPDSLHRQRREEK
jgi:hypothetical protein